MQYIYAFVITINIVGFVLMGYDKHKARTGKWRIPELNLFLIGSLGGAAGLYAGMKVFRHKTKHNSFTIGIPFLFGINLIIAYLIVALAVKTYFI